MARRLKRRHYLRTIRSALKTLVILAAIAACVLVALAYIRERPQDLPWTQLQLDKPIGMFTGQKLAALSGDYAFCQNLLDRAGVAFSPLPPVGDGECRRDENIRLLEPIAGNISFTPSGLAPSCPVAAALEIWENQIVQPAALEHFGQRVSTIRHLGTYNCRQIAGSNRWSEHATGNAIDIAAFTLESGQIVSLRRDWVGTDPEAEFLRAIRDGSCDLFATVLSPDYNAAHADHFHLDQAERGQLGYSLCR